MSKIPNLRRKGFYTRDNVMTFDSASRQAPIDVTGNHRGVTFDQSYRIPTADGAWRTVDSTGAFLVGELERLDQTMNLPLAEVSYGRDLDLREDVTIADETSSFTRSSFASPGTMGGNGIRTGKAWVGKASNQIGSLSVDIAKIPQALTAWSLELKWSILELEAAARLGRPLDSQELEALQLKYQMDTDEQAYVGDAQVAVNGLVNHTEVTNLTNVPNGAAASPLWSTKTPDEILKDINEVLISGWTASGYKVMPNRILLPPVQFGALTTRVVSTGGSVSILKFVLENNILATSGQGELKILPLKWLVGAGTGGTIGTTGTVDRMIAYTKDRKYVRFPMTMLQHTPVQYEGLYHKTTYYGKLGAVEMPYPETVTYRDGI